MKEVRKTWTAREELEARLEKLSEERKAIKDFYKTATGSYMIDLQEGYTTSYGTSYIERKTKKECLYELENFVSKN